MAESLLRADFAGVNELGVGHSPPDIGGVDATSEEVAKPPLTERTGWSSAVRKRLLARSDKRWNLF
jgi:hypothetical protein